MKLLKKIFIAVFILGFVFAPLGSASAARFSQLSVDNKGDFVLEPGKIEVFVNPGETVERTISVINRINKKVKFKVEVEDFIGSDNPNTPVILLGTDTSPYSFKDNLLPELNEFTLGFGQKIELPIKVQPPENAQPGGYYSSVIISTVPDVGAADGAAGGAKVISRVGVLFFVRVNGPVDQSGALEDFRTGNGDRFMQKGPVDFEILFKNEGTVHLVPYGMITIKNILGKEVGKVPVDAYFALPKSLRYRQVTWNQTRLLGKYTAELKLNRGYEGQEDIQKIVFWAIPWSYILTLLFVLLVITMLWRFVSTRFEFKRKRN